MTELIKDFIVDVFGSYAWLGIIIIAMIPIIELRGAIPFALSSVWGISKLSALEAYFYSVLGATLPAIIIIPLLIPFFDYLKKTKLFKKIALAFEKKFKKNSDKIEQDIESEESAKKIRLKKFIGVMTFVAIPLPLTGAWTGSAVAAYLKMRFWDGLFAVLLGNIISGGIMTSLCLLFPNSVDLILNVFLIVAAIVIVGGLVIAIFKKGKTSKATEA